MKHTPGPWELDEMFRVIANKKGFKPSPAHTKFIVANNVYISGSREEQRANAHLIAAAPELLEACRTIDNILGKMSPPETCGPDELSDTTDLIRYHIREAIAKAEGKVGVL